MYLLSKQKIPVPQAIFLTFILLTAIGIQIKIIQIIPQYATVIIFFLILVFTLLIVQQAYIRDLPAFLLFLTFLPLLLLDNNFHYHFRLEILSFIPLYILVILAVYSYLLREIEFNFRISYIELPIILMTGYFAIISILSLSGGKDPEWIANEYFHLCLYLMIIPVSYLFTSRAKYSLVLKFLLLLAIVIAIEYIVFNGFIFNKRFVTFQSSFLPLAVGVLFAYSLFTKKRIKKLIWLIGLTIVIIGIIFTLTRTLWVSSFIVLFAVFIIYLKVNNKLSYSKVGLILLTLIIPFMIFKDSSQQSISRESSTTSIEYKTKSISNPLEDASFIMRIELGYYAIERFLQNPIFGSGLGDFVKFRIFPNPTPIYYLDNSWLYFLWKGGLIGFLLFLWIYLRFFKAAFFVLKRTDDLRVKIICVGLMGGFIGLSFLAFLAPVLNKYKATAIISFLFAYVEFERKQLTNKQIKKA
jgi:hypothetical protein